MFGETCVHFIFLNETQQLEPAEGEDTHTHTKRTAVRSLFLFLQEAPNTF